MDIQTFTITSGLPFGKEINVTLPTGRDWWTQISEFEVLSQVRKARARESQLIMDLADYITVEMTGADTIKINLTMTGADTRLLQSNGVFDIVISDTGITDARAYILVQGLVKRQSTVTAELEDSE